MKKTEIKLSLTDTLKGHMQAVAHFLFRISYFFAGCFVLFTSCSNPEVVNVAEIRAKAKQDSTLRAQYDQKLINQYLKDPVNNINRNQVHNALNGVKYIVSNPVAPSEAPKVSDILSLNYSAQFLNHQVYFTNDKQIALATDSSNWAARWAKENRGQSFKSNKLQVGLPPRSEIDAQGKTLAAVLEELAKTKEPLNYTLYRNSRVFVPVVVNLTPTLSELSENFTAAFRSGLAKALSQMNRKSKATLFIPSAAGFGVKGNSTVPPNTVLIYTFQIVKIRH